ncbi:MAG: hypothetical protein M1371_02325 [Actinobacteria bacterium]|nr:hypothetical protein [Actinomycetota bacterium]
MEKKQTGSTKALIIVLIVVIVLLVLAIVGFLAVRFLLFRAPAEAIVSVIIDVQDEAGSKVDDVDNILLKVSGEGFKEFEKNIDVDGRKIKLKVPSGEERTFEAVVDIGGVEFSKSEKVDLLPKSENDLNIVVKATLVAGETTGETTSEETTEETAQQVTTTSEGATSTTAGGATATAPTVEIDRIYGPVSEGGFCVQRFKAIVTGTPKPTISWNHDDSDHAFGNDVAQVNLDPGEDFDLKVTVTNSAGSDTDTRHVTYECEEPNHPPDITGITAEGFGGGNIEINTSSSVVITVTATDADGDPLNFDSSVASGGIGAESNPDPNSYRFTYTAPAAAGTYNIQITVEDGKGGSDTASKSVNVVLPTHTVTLNAVAGETGYIDTAGNIFTYSAFAGDDTAHRVCRGYISFDISSLAGKHIVEATLNLAPISTWGDYSGMGVLYLGNVSYGTGGLVPGDYGLLSDPLTNYPAATVGNVSLSSATLVSRLQALVSASNPRMQFRIHWSGEGAAPDNGAFDGVGWLPANCKLNVTYTD